MSDPSGQPPGRASGGGNTSTVARLLGGEQNAGFIQTIIDVLGFMSLSVEVFLRRDFGERYLSVIRFILAWIIFSFFTLGGQVLSSLPLLGRAVPANAASSAAAGVVFFQILYWGFVVLGVYHLWRIFRRNRKGERWYSYSFGISHFNGLAGLKIGPFTVDDWTLFRFIEPLFIFVLALVAGRISGTAGGWLWLAGFTLLIKNNYLYSKERGRILDIMDGQIQQDFYRDALKGEDKRKTAGFTMVRPPASIDRDRDGIPDVLQTEGQRPDFGDDMADAFGERTQREPETPPIVTPPPVRPDFGDVMADTFGEQASEPRGEQRQEDTRPFDPAVPQSAGSGTAVAAAAPREQTRSAPPAPAPSTIARYAPLGAFALILALLAVFSFVSPREPQTGPQAAPTARPGAPTSAAAPGLAAAPTDDNIARPIATSSGVVEGPVFQAPRPANPGQSAGVATPRQTAAAAPVATVAAAPVATVEEIVPEGDAAAVAGQVRQYSVTAQEPQSTLRVLVLQQTEAASILTVEYMPTDARKVGIDAPGGENAFYLLSNGQRYALTSSDGIAVGSTSQSVTVGQPFLFTLRFERLPDISQPFDLIEGEHSASESASYWDIKGIRLRDAP